MTRGETTSRRGWRALYPGINARVTAPFLLVIIIVAGLGVFIVTRLVAGSIQERFNNQLKDSATAAKNAIVDLERQQLATLRLMVFTDGVASAIQDGNAGDLDLWLRPIAANARVSDVVVYNETGQGVLWLSRNISSGIVDSVEYATLPSPELGGWEGVQRVLAARTDELGDKFVDLIDDNQGGTTFFTNAPITLADGEIIGGIAVGIPAQTVASRASDQALSAVTLFLNDGRILGNTLRVADTEMITLSTAEASRLMTEVQIRSPLEDLEVDGIPYQVLYAPFELRSQNLGLLAVALPSNFIVEQSSTSRDIFAVIFTGLFVGVSILGILTARSITQPISKLVDTTRAIRSGDLSRRVQLQTPDELGELSVSFDHMTDQLVRRNEQINTLYLEQVAQTAQRHAVLSSISDAVIVQNLSKKIILRNRTAKQLINDMRVNSKPPRQFLNILKNPGALAEPRTFEFADGFYSVLATPVRLPSGVLLGHVIVFRDITAIVEAERIKDEMILQLSHELRTPLTAARGYVDLVTMVDGSNISDQGHGFIESATHSMSDLERMINQVIDVSAMVANRFTVDFDTFDLIQILQDAVDTWHETSASRELKLSLFSPLAELSIEADPIRIPQVIDHLLRNAYSYTLPGGKIEVEAEIRGVCVAVSVRDTGVGIGPDEIDKVFERAYRGASADAGPTDARGLGLGLYLSRQIVSAHGGKISLVSELDFGTVVTVELPVQQGERS